MFTGRIEEIGEVASFAGERIVVRVPKIASVVRPGGSLNVAGVCVTVEDVADGTVTATVSAETRRRTTFDCCGPGQRPSGRVIPRVAAKGPIAVDGVSLTVAEVTRDRFTVVLIPATVERTTLGGLAAGDRVNLESDLVARLAAAGSGAEVARAVSSLGWAGHVSGRAGAEKVVAQLAAGGAVLVWDPGTRPHIPVDLTALTGTGVSAAERAATVRRLADPAARPADFLRPGHVFPLAARPGLLAERACDTEATVALCTAAGLPPVGVCCEVMNPDGTMARSADLEAAALRWGLPLVDVSDLRAWL